MSWKNGIFICVAILRIHSSVSDVLDPEKTSTPLSTSPSTIPSTSQRAWENFKSPVTTDAKYPLILGAGLTGLLLIFEDQLIDPSQKETVEDKPLKSFSRFGDYGGRGYTNGLYVLGMMGYGFFNSDSEAKKNASSMFQATAYSTAVTYALKYSIREPRPDSGARESFPSGHTSSAFSFASYIGCQHSLGWGLAAYTLAGFVGYSRSRR